MKLTTKLKQISHYCSEHDNQCHGCIYFSKNYWCIPMEIADYCSKKCPDEWDMKEIEKRLDDEILD